MKKILLIIFGIIFSLVIMETGLRFAAWIAQSNLNNSSFSGDGKLKILCLGDSYTYGLGVERNQAYPAQLESLLKKKLGKDKIEVINAGRPGMNTPLLADNFDSLLDKYQPDMVLLMIGTNDEWNFSGFVSEPTTIMDKLYTFICSLKISKMFKIVKTAFKEKQEISFPEIEADKKNISKMLNLIEARGGLNNSFYYQAVMLGNQYRDMHKFDEAKLYYDCALKINPEDVLISKELLRYHQNVLRISREDLKKNNITEILKEVDRLGGFDKGYYNDLIKMGNEYRDNGMVEEAKLYYDRASRINPNDYLISKELTRSQKHEPENDSLEKNKANISNYIRSVYLNKEQLEPDNEFMLEMIDLSKVCRVVSLFEDNLLLLTKTIYLYGFSQEIWEELDELFIAWPYPLYAIKFYQILSEKYADNVDVYLRLVSQFKRVQDYEQVVKYRDKVLAIDPNDLRAISSLEMDNEFIEQGLSKEYVLSDINNQLFAQINSVLDGGKSRFQSDDSADNIVKNSSIALSVDTQENEYDSQIEKVFYKGKNYAELFRTNHENQDVFVKQRLTRINDIVFAKLKQICVSAKQRKIKIIFLSYPLSVYQTVQEAAESEDIQFIDLRQSFYNALSLDDYKDYFLADGHCTEKGYKIAADKITEIILP